MKILIVDDYEDGAHILSRFVQLQGHEPMVAHDGFEAISEARQFQPDLVLMDIQIPGMDGYTAARRILSEPALSQTLIVALTADPSDPRERAAGMRGYCRKPIDFEQFGRLLKTHAALKARSVAAGEPIAATWEPSLTDLGDSTIAH